MTAVRHIPVGEYLALQSELQRLQDKILELESQLQMAQKQTIATVSKKELVIIHHKGIKRMLQIRDICAIKGDSNYSTILLRNGEKILVTRTLKDWMLEFTEVDKMKRVHKSYIVNIENILTYKVSTGEISMEGGIVAYSSSKLKSGLLG